MAKTKTKTKTKAQWLKKIKEYGQYGWAFQHYEISDKDWARLNALRKEGKIYLLEEDIGWRAIIPSPRFGTSNPTHRLKVTASTEVKAKTKARRFGRVVHVQHQGGDRYNVTVDQPKMGNPVLSWLPAERKKRWAGLTDIQLREEIADLREEIRLNKVGIKKLGKHPTLQQMIAHGVPQELWEENETIQREIDGIKAILEARKAERKTKREAKKPSKTPVMRRRKGVVSQINPKSSERVKNVHDIVRKAMR